VAWAYCTPQYSGSIRKLNETKHNVALPKSILQIHPDLTIPYKPSNVAGKESAGSNIGTPLPGNSCSRGGYFQGVIAYQIYLNYKVNHDVFNNNSKIKVALAHGVKKSASDYTDITNGEVTIELTFDNQTSGDWYRILYGRYQGWKYVFSSLGIKAKLYPQNAPAGVSPVDILRSYYPDYGTLTNHGVE
jgi:hypothetical protein